MIDDPERRGLRATVRRSAEREILRDQDDRERAVGLPRSPHERVAEVGLGGLPMTFSRPIVGRRTVQHTLVETAGHTA